MPYNFFSNPQLPQQQVIEVNGKASIDSMRLAPNSSILAMDKTAPIVWLCISDGLGNTTATAYDITPHVEEPPVDMRSIEGRLAEIEEFMREIRNGKSNDTKNGNKQNGSNNNAN